MKVSEGQVCLQLGDERGLVTVLSEDDVCDIGEVSSFGSESFR